MLLQHERNSILLVFSNIYYYPYDTFFPEACSWRSDSTRCYPGSCSTELSSSCTCSFGFGGIHCQNSKLAHLVWYIERSMWWTKDRPEETETEDEHHSQTDILLHTLTCTAKIVKEHEGMQISRMKRKNNHGRPDQAGIKEKTRF